jgi:hypothetical protein
MENPTKIDKVIEELNHKEVLKEAPGTLADGGVWQGSWEAEPGYFAVTAFHSTGPKEGEFIPSLGVPLKVFTNRRTSEVRLYLSERFED